MPQSAYSPTGKALPAAKDMQKAFASGLKSEIESAGERAGQGIGQRVGAINDDLSSILEARKPMANELRKANTKNAVSSVDAAGLGYMATNPIGGAALMTGKKLGDLSKTTVFRTKGGKALYNLGQSNMLDPFVRQMLIQQNRPITPWDTQTDQVY